jgi:alkylhydroperoxidase/carboxymuconolactone decarboxylase family protein YurZ
MTRNLIAASILSLAFAGIGTAQGQDLSAKDGKQTTQAQVAQLERKAQTPEQYKALASYFGTQQNKYLQMASEEKKEWDRRSQNIVSIAAKYPRPVDSARNLYEYYMYKASENGSLEAKYSHLAASSAPVNGQ